MTKNPVLLIIGGLGTIVQGGMGLLMAYGVDISKGKQAATTGFVTIIATLVLSIITRDKVTPYDPSVDNTAETTALYKVADQQNKDLTLLATAAPEFIAAKKAPVKKAAVRRR